MKEFLKNLPYINLPKDLFDAKVYNITPNIQVMTDMNGTILAAWEIK